jgi:ParB family chromosome partitioning protein
VTEPRARKALGRGLAALIPDVAAPEAGESLLTLDIDLVSPSPDQPRKSFDPDELQALARSIAEQGVISPVVVREHKGRYELVAGERRWRAAQLAGLRAVPAIVRNLTRPKALEVALVENIQRAQLNPIEEALAYQALQDEFQLKVEEIARKVGRDRSSVANTLRLLKLTPSIQKLVAAGKLTSGHARALLAVDDGPSRDRLAARIVAEGLTVRDVERLATRAPRPRPRRAAPSADVFLRNAQEKLQRALATKVRIERQGKGGRIVIEYYSEEELSRLYDRLARP